jgi:GNAT superfamily N-acetyltransferase
MALSLRSWSFEDEGEWKRFLTLFIPYLKETTDPQDFEQNKNAFLDAEYRENILRLSQRKKNPYLTYELMLDGKGIGFAQDIVFSDEHLKSLLANIYVLPSYRNQGYGSAFYDLLEQDLLARDARYVDCSIAPKALSFYARKGYQKTNDLLIENHLPAYRKFLSRPFPYQKMIVLGSPGAGKSYLSRELARRFLYPVVHMDVLYWRQDWAHLSDEEMLKALDKVLSEKSWIIDGNYASTLEHRYQKADIVFFLDYPPEICLEGEKSRRGAPRDDFPSFLKEGEDPGFLNFIATFPQNGRPTILGMANRYLHTPFIRFSSREECNQFLSLYPVQK